jgi:hypothetical protein
MNQESEDAESIRNNHQLITESRTFRVWRRFILWLFGSCLSPAGFESAELPQRQRKSMVRASEFYLISADYISRRAIEHLPRLGYCRLSKMECRDRSEDSSLSRILHIDRDRVARLQP